MHSNKKNFFLLHRLKIILNLQTQQCRTSPESKTNFLKVLLFIHIDVEIRYPPKLTNQDELHCELQQRYEMHITQEKPQMIKKFALIVVVFKGNSRLQPVRNKTCD